MGEEVHAVEGGGDLAAIAVAEEVKGHSCWQCGRVFSAGNALGGHMSSAHGALQKTDSSSKKMRCTEETPNQKTSEDSRICKFTCDLCGKGFASVKGLHGHMRLHPGRDKRGTKPTTKSLIENPPEILADIAAADSEHPPTAPEDSINNLWARTVTGKRGRRGTKPHLADTPESYLAKKKALLSCDPRELRKIIDHHDPTGYFRRAFGNFLNSPVPERKKSDIIQGSFENMETISPSSYHCSSSPLLCSEKSNIADLKSKSIEHGKRLEETARMENRLTGKKRKTMDSIFAQNKITKKLKTNDSHTGQGIRRM